MQAFTTITQMNRCEDVFLTLVFVVVGISDKHFCSCGLFHVDGWHGAPLGVVEEKLRNKSRSIMYR